jgi:hypothetical protein
MARHAPDPFSLGLGLVVLLVGLLGLTGHLDLRTVWQGWLGPALVVVMGLAVLTSLVRAR